MRFVMTIVCVAASSSAAFGRVSTEENDSDFDDIAWQTATGQDEFDGTPLLAENSDVMVAAVTPAVVKIGQIYSVPYAQSVEQKNDKPGATGEKDDDLADHAAGVSLVSLLSLAVLAWVAMAAGKALLLASGAIIVACLSGASWTWPGGTREPSDSAAVHGVYGTRAHHRGPYGDEVRFFGRGRRRQEERSARKS